MKVIASSLRKGNIVDLDGKLYVVLNAENFHPGKGTPTTQVDMRRISDGVKTQMRYKTTGRTRALLTSETLLEGRSTIILLASQLGSGDHGRRHVRPVRASIAPADSGPHDPAG